MKNTITVDEKLLSRYGFVMPREVAMYESFTIAKDLMSFYNKKEYLRFIAAVRPTSIDVAKCNSFIRPFMSKDMVAAMERQQTLEVSDAVSDVCREEIMAYQSAKFKALNSYITPYFKESNSVLKTAYNAMIMGSVDTLNAIIGPEIGLTLSASGFEEVKHACYDYKSMKYRSCAYFSKLFRNIIAFYSRPQAVKVARALVHMADTLVIVVDEKGFRSLGVRKVREMAKRHCPKSKYLREKTYSTFMLKEQLLDKGFICIMSDEALAEVRNIETTCD